MKRFSLVVGLILFGLFSVYADDFVEITPYFFAANDGVNSASSFRTSSYYSDTNVVRTDLEAFFERRLTRCFFISDQNKDAEDKAVEQETINLLGRNIIGYPNIPIGSTYGCIYIREPGVDGDGYLIFLRYTSTNNWEYYTYYFSFR